MWWEFLTCVYLHFVYAFVFLISDATMQECGFMLSIMSSLRLIAIFNFLLQLQIIVTYIALECNNSRNKRK